MHGHHPLAALLGQLEALERSARELFSPMLTGQVEALRQQVLTMAGERAHLEEARDLALAKVARLEDALAENTRRHEVSLGAFERFRRGLGMVQAMRSLGELPELLIRLTALFRVSLVRLVLDQDHFADYTGALVPLMPQAELAAMSQALGRAGCSAYLGPVECAPQGLFSSAERRRLGSCFVYPLADRFRDDLVAGVVVVADTNPGRYLPDMATDFMEHFFDSVCREVTDVADRLRADRLREDVDRITRHDLKSPLSAILTLPQLLLEEPGLGDRQREMVRLLLDSARRMQDMINLSLSLYRMEQGIYELSPAVLDGAALVRAVWADAGAPYAQAGYGLRLEAPHEPFELLGEELLCYTMLANLMKNALEASQPGDLVRVSLGRTPGWVEIAVANDQNVPEEMRGAFFKKYATCGKPGGSGLGTYSAWLIAKTHGGGVELETGTGQTVVRVRLPDGMQAK